MRLPLLVFALSAGLVAATDADEPNPPTFRIEAGLVNVVVTVTDQKGRYIDNLNAEDFTLLENEVPQSIAALDRQAPPLDLVLMIDVSASMTSMTPIGSALDVAKKAAQQFVTALRPEDRVLVVTFSDTPSAKPPSSSDDDPFSNNREFLQKTIDSLDIAYIIELEFNRKTGQDEPVIKGRPTKLYQCLSIVLRDVFGKKYARNGNPEKLRRPAIVMLTDGEENASGITSDQIMNEARASGVSVHSVMMPQEIPAIDAWQKQHQARNFLSTLAKETGGSLQEAVTFDDIRKSYQLIARELSAQYRIGYPPRNTNPDGTWRRIVVAVRGRPDLVVRHRVGYWSAKVASR